MKKLIMLEEAAQFAASVILLWLQPVSVPFWLWFILFFSPDIFMLGYLAGPRVGALTYNFGHHKAVAIAVAVAGYFFTIPWLLIAGVLLFGHSSFDRMMGYGLKLNTGFNDTHLGETGKKKQPL